MSMRDLIIVLLAFIAFAVVTFCLRAADSHHSNTSLFRGQRKHRVYRNRWVSFVYHGAWSVAIMLGILGFTPLLIALIWLWMNSVTDFGALAVGTVILGALGLGLFVFLYWIVDSAKHWTDSRLSPEEMERRAQEKARKRQQEMLREQREQEAAAERQREREIRAEERRQEYLAEQRRLELVDYVYMVRNERFIKVGRTRNLQRRLREHRTQGLTQVMHTAEMASRDESLALEREWKSGIRNRNAVVSRALINDGHSETAWYSQETRELAERIWSRRVDSGVKAVR